MKVLILLFVVGASYATSVVYKHPWVHSGSSSSYQTSDNVGNYAFGYHVGKPHVASYHQEYGTPGGGKVGSYGSTSPDGKVNIVDYVADQGGYRPNIKTSDEVGEERPADVTINEARVENIPLSPYAYPRYGGYYVAY